MLALWEYFLVSSDWSTAAANALSLSGPGSGTIATASSPFTVTANGSLSGVCVVTMAVSGGTGTFTPTTLSLSAGTTFSTFTFTPLSAGAYTISITNSQALSNGTALTYSSNAATVVTEDNRSNAGGGGKYDVQPPDYWDIRGEYLLNQFTKPKRVAPKAWQEPDVPQVPYVPTQPDPAVARQARAQFLADAQQRLAAQQQQAQQQEAEQQVAQQAQQLSLQASKLMRQQNDNAAVSILLDIL